MKCLVADRSVTLRTIVAQALRRAGPHQILEARSVEQALGLVDGATDVVVTGWDLEGGDGLELVRQLRAGPETAGVRVLLVTDRNTRDDVLQGVRAGANHILLRPFTPEALTHQVGAVLTADAPIPASPRV